MSRQTKLTMHKIWQDKFNDNDESYFSVDRELFLRKGKSAKKSAALYALRFVERNKDRLSTFDIVDLSALTEDLSGGYIPNKKEEKLEALKLLCQTAFDKLSHTTIDKIAPADIESYLTIIDIYKKSVSHHLPDNIKNLRDKLHTILNPQPGSEFVISQQVEDKEFQPLHITEIDEAAQAFFRQADEYEKGSDKYKELRKKGNRSISEACQKYIKDYIHSNEDWNRLSTKELVYLYKNLRRERKLSQINAQLLAQCEQRSRTAENQINAGKIQPEEDIAALKEFCRIRLHDLKGRSDESALLETAACRSVLRKLNRAGKMTPAPQEEKQVSAAEPAAESAAEPATVEEPANAELAAKFEESCNKRKIKFDRQEKENQIEYALYAPRAAGDAEPNGKLTIKNDNNVTLQSEEFQHFVALAQAAKANGAPSLQVGELNKDETEAKKFVAMLVLAGHVAKIEVKHQFKLEQLAEVNPEIKKMQEIQRLEHETRVAFEAMKKASGEQKASARTIYHQKLIAKTQHYIENGGIYDTSSPEKRREKIVQERQRHIENQRGNRHQQAESQAVLDAIRQAKVKTL